MVPMRVGGPKKLLGRRRRVGVCVMEGWHVGVVRGSRHTATRAIPNLKHRRLVCLPEENASCQLGGYIRRSYPRMFISVPAFFFFR